MSRFLMPSPCGAPGELRGIAARTRRLLVHQGHREGVPGPFRVFTLPRAVQGATVGQGMAAGRLLATRLQETLLGRCVDFEEGHKKTNSVCCLTLFAIGVYD
ncbi:hypothetical protein NDU88_005184 [Pleurodeles waltl]|uniref:Uncharacterized protein n=1 Tax=Pleurodeles waltl TaxID=8319 RepID=A0AAV7M8K2_PLEWA|nr:hypothetical protein NDU88_005184 [Pleurodeles waltl]